MALECSMCVYVHARATKELSWDMTHVETEMLVSPHDSVGTQHMCQSVSLHHDMMVLGHGTYVNRHSCVAV